VIGEAAPDRHHLAMGGRIVIGFAEIVSVCDHRTIARDHAAESIIALPRFIERHAHEALVLGRGFGFRVHGTRRRRRGGRCERDDDASPAGQLRRIDRLDRRMRVAVIAGVSH
jgi:hypothetical protein